MDFDCIEVLNGHAQDVKRVVWHPHNEWAVSVSYDNTIKLWYDSEDTWHLGCTMNGHKSTVWDVAFEGKGYHFVTCADDRSVCVWTSRGLTNTLSRESWQFDATKSFEDHHDGCVYS